jgi:branched-chain amino acid transport system ATP-binding protein
LPLLELDEVTVRFGGLTALFGASLTAEPGQVTGLIGPNGAGKTTMFNVISGLQKPTSGRAQFADQDVSAKKPHERSRLGMARTFQRLEIFGSLSARQNILVAAEARKRWSKDSINCREVTEECLERVGLMAAAEERVDSMPTGHARLVEIGRALALGPRLLLLDEPSSGLGEGRESEFLAELLVRLADGGLAILLVEHDVEMVMSVCKKIFVLDFGRMIASGTPEEIQKNEAVQAAYLGAEGGADDAA